MFHKIILALFFTSLSISTLFTSEQAIAGGAGPSAIVTASDARVTTGSSVTISLAYSCDSSWTTATVQLFRATDDEPNLTSQNRIGDALVLASDPSNDRSGTVSTVVTFSQTGDYLVSAKITNVQYQSNSEIGYCALLRAQTSQIIVVDPVNIAIEANTSTNITVGQSVDFTLTYSCPDSWTTATAQLFSGTTMTNSNKLGSTIHLEFPTGQSQTSVSTSKTITFTEVGTFTINASIPEAIYDDGTNRGSADSCEIANTTPVTVTVRAIATTTTVASATLVPASTTVSATSLPKTGTDPNNALIALAVMTAGVAIIAGRRRLLTK